MGPPRCFMAALARVQAGAPHGERVRQHRSGRGQDGRSGRNIIIIIIIIIIIGLWQVQRARRCGGRRARQIAARRIGPADGSGTQQDQAEVRSEDEEAGMGGDVDDEDDDDAGIKAICLGWRRCL